MMDGIVSGIKIILSNITFDIIINVEVANDGLFHSKFSSQSFIVVMVGSQFTAWMYAFEYNI